MTQNIGPKVNAYGDQPVSITNPTSLAANLFATITPFGGLNVTMDAQVLFADTFEGTTIDTTNRWTTTGTVAPTQSTGLLNINPAATASATTAVNTIPTFTPVNPLTFAWVAAIETTIATGNHRFMGIGTPPTPPGTAAAPLQDAMGFEIDTTGALRASVYSNGTRTYTSVLTIPTDGAYHRYAVVVRGDIVFWYRDAFDIPLASTMTTPMTGVLPMRFASLNSASVTGTPTLTINGCGVLDQGRAGVQISDGTYPWRKSKVDQYGSQSAALQTPAGAAVPARPDAYLRIAPDPSALLSETFDSGTIDTTDKWTSLGTAPTAVNGTGTFDASTTALAFSGLQSKVTFPLLGNMFNESVFVVKLDAAAKTGNYRFFGQGTAQAAPTSTLPLVNGVGFELLDSTGALQGCVWSAGTETQSVVLTRPTDGSWHRYAVYYKTSRVYFEIDNVTVGSLAYPSPAQSNLPLLVLSVNGASTVSPTATLQATFAGVGDTSGNNTMISDGTQPWRKAKIGPFGDQSVSIVNPVGAAAGLAVGVTTYGFMRATLEPHVLFSDAFDGASINTTDRWTLGGTVTPTAVSGRMTIAQGATLSATSTANTQPTFIFQGLNFLATGWIGKFETASAANGGLFYLNSHRFMGLGVPPTTLASAYTASSTTGPMLDAIGYEIDTDGLMYPVVYANGVRTRPTLTFGGTNFNTGNGTANTAINPGGSRALADGNFHTYGVAIRGDYIFWYVDGSDYPAAQLTYKSSTYTVPNTQQLPLRFHAVNGTVTAPSGTMTMQVGSIGIADTGSNHIQIGDYAYPWRKATVTKTGGLSTIPGPSTLAGYTGISEATFTLVANTRKDALSIEHAASSTKTVKIRRITVAAYNTSAVTGFVYCKVFYGTAATSAGTVATPTKVNEAAAAADAVVKTNPTIVAATQKLTAGIGLLSATTGAGVGPVTIYDATAGADMDALTLRAGVLETLTVAVYSTGANALQPLINVYFTEE